MSESTESRNPKDTPLSELDCEIFIDFYSNFLAKTDQEKLTLLKSLTLMRQGRIRPYLHSIVSARKLAEAMLPTVAERELLLAFPSTLEALWSVVIDSRQGEYRNTSSIPIRSMVVNYLAQIGQARDELNRLLKQVRAIQPKDKFEIAITLANTGRLKKAAQLRYKYFLVILADHPFFCILPDNAPNSTMALGKLRSYLEQTLKEAISNLPLEFFVVGGGYLSKEQQVKLVGNNPIFDITFNNPVAPFSYRVLSQYFNAKFELAREILKEEFPSETIIWEY
ncbi:MAG: hypothetical protein AB1489_10080 [Acidobacteriota bacterium]